MSEKKIVGILVFTTEDTYRHKLKDTHCYWQMKNLPKKIRENVDTDDQLTFYPLIEIRLYMAVKEIVMGYFLFGEIIDMQGYYHCYIKDGSWHPIPDGEKKNRHQGFEYYLHKEGK